MRAASMSADFVDLQFFFLMLRRLADSTLFPYTTLFRSEGIRARDDFLSIAAHELKTPLTPMRLVADSLLRDTRRKGGPTRSEEHTSELQSHSDLVCRLLLEKKKRQNTARDIHQHQSRHK